MFLRTEFNYDVDAASNEHATPVSGETMTKQSFKEECDINTIVRRFGLTGEMPVNVRMPSYGDFTGVWDYRSAMDALIQARDSFEAMPAEVRRRFNDDPAEFVDFCSNKDNLDEARKLGLVVPAAVQAAADLAVPPKSVPADKPVAQ